MWKERLFTAAIAIVVWEFRFEVLGLITSLLRQT